MKKIFYSITFCLAALLGNGQVWNTVGTSPQHSGNSKTCLVGSNLAVVRTTTSANQVIVSGQMWDGLSWAATSTITNMGGSTHLSNLVGMGNAMYTIFHGSLREFDGQNWSTVTLPNGQNPSGVFEVGSSLLITNWNWMYLYDGTTFTLLPSTPNPISIRTAIEMNGDIFIGGYLDSNSNNGPINIYQLNNGSWANPVSTIAGGTLGTTSPHVAHLVEYNGSLHALTGLRLLEISGGTATVKATINNSPKSVAIYGGDLYFSSHGSTGTPLHSYDGTSVTAYPNAPTDMNLIVYQNELYGFNGTTMFNGVTHNGAFRTQAGFSTISGNVFSDADQDCTLDAGEVGNPGMAVEFSTGDIVSTDQNGNYSVALAPGNHSITNVYPISQLLANVTVNCSLPINFSLSANASITENVGAELAQVEDVSVHVIGAWRARYGFTEQYTVVVSNLGLPTSAGTVELLIPNTVNLLGTIPTATQSMNTLTWSVPALNSFEQAFYTVSLEIDTATNSVGDTLQLIASLFGYPNDADANNNTETLAQEVRAAYDPNDKQVNIEKAEPGSLALDYYIRFQNTGNDTAYKVVVVDSLSSVFDLSSFRFLGATHECETYLNNNVASFVFENILLPDSTTDLEASQGGLRFSIETASALVDGDQVMNDAYIYFDFQLPIHTNYAITEIEASISLAEQLMPVLSLELYPNPATNFVQLKSQSNQRQEVGLYNAKGQELKHISLPAKGSMKLQLNDLSNGLYFVKTETETYKVLISR